jgi:magnesium transporter
MTITLIHIGNGTTTELGHDAPRPLTTDGTVWLDVNAPTEQDLHWLACTYRFHPLTIEDLRNFNQRAKVEAYDEASTRGVGPGGYLFLSLTTTRRENGELHPLEMEAFLGPDYLITVHREPLAAIQEVQEHVGREVRADFLLYMLCDHMADAYFPLLDEVEDEIDELEDEILENATQETLHRIFALKQQLVLLRKITGPLRDVMNALAGTRYGLISAPAALYFRDVYDHLIRIYDLIETSRDLLGNSLDAYLSTVSNRLGEVMKRLTLTATIFLPISFLVGFGGMNFEQLPFDKPAAFAMMMALIVLVPTVMLIWFWRSKWM